MMVDGFIVEVWCDAPVGERDLSLGEWGFHSFHTDEASAGDECDWLGEVFRVRYSGGVGEFTVVTQVVEELCPTAYTGEEVQ